jgi:hypothetical protein
VVGGIGLTDDLFDLADAETVQTQVERFEVLEGDGR